MSPDDSSDTPTRGIPVTPEMIDNMKDSSLKEALKRRIAEQHEAEDAEP